MGSSGAITDLPAVLVHRWDHMISAYIVTLFTTNYKKQIVTNVRPVPWFPWGIPIISTHFYTNSKTDGILGEELFTFLQCRTKRKKESGAGAPLCVCMDYFLIIMFLIHGRLYP